jgi:hypothetical protein
MRFNDGAADGQSHARPLKLRRKEGIEDLIRLLHGQPHAGIADGHQNLLIFISLGLYAELPSPLHVLHRIDAIEHEVHQHLLQLHAICHHLGNICGQLCPD